MSESPFIPGARVAVTERYGDGVREAFVEKVYKNGNFTLRDSKQQWKPWQSTWSSGPKWSATETGSGYSRCRLDIWDSAADKEISERIDLAKAKHRLRFLRIKLDAVRHPTTAFCDALDTAFATLEPKP